MRIEKIITILKDIVEVPNPFRPLVWVRIAIAGIALVSVGLVAWMVRRKKLLKVLAPWKQALQLSPFEEVLSGNWTTWQNERLIEVMGRLRRFIAGVGDILRLYLFRRMGIASLFGDQL